MKTILFTKTVGDRSIAELVELGHRLGLDGFDLCVRPEHPITPENAARALPEAVAALRAEGLEVPLLSAETSLTDPEAPVAETLLAAMAVSGVSFLKIGYFILDPGRETYAEAFDRARRALAGWETMARRHGVTMLYHTHCGPCLGLNGSALVHLLAECDPTHVAAYLDPAHLVLDGEPFPFAFAAARPWLRAMALKDVLPVREERNGHGAQGIRWVEAGAGMVDWTTVFATLRDAGFDGPASIHAEFECAPERFDAVLAAEVDFFLRAGSACTQ